MDFNLMKRVVICVPLAGTGRTGPGAAKLASRDIVKTNLMAPISMLDTACQYSDVTGKLVALMLIADVVIGGAVGVLAGSNSAGRTQKPFWSRQRERERPVVSV
jgi:hypothetical protein